MPEKKIISKSKKQAHSRKQIIRACSIIGAAVLVIAVGIYVLVDKYIDSKLEKIHYATGDENVSYVTGEYIDPADEQPVDTFEGNLTWEKNFVPGVEDPSGLPCICDTEDVLNIVVIGIDARKPNEASRNDTTILVSINTKTKEIVMASFLRDILVNYPNKEPNRINCAYIYGGPDYLFKTLKNNFNINVSHYVTFNFFSFIDLIDAMGGLEIDLTASEAKYVNYYLLETNKMFNRPEGTDNIPEKDGPVLLNGYQALGYARNRYSGLRKEDGTIGTGSDFARTTRQRMIIQMLIDKAKDLSVFQLDDVLDTMLPKVTTNLEKDFIKSMIRKLPTYITYNINSFNVPQTGTWKYGKYYYAENKYRSIIEVDFKKAITALYNEIYKPEN